MSAADEFVVPTDAAVRAGWEFPTVTLSVPRAEQHTMHGYCDIPLSLYGDRLDPGFLARYPIRVIGRVMFHCYPDRAYVHMVQRIEQKAPAMLDEPITVKGRFTEIEDVPRGWVMKAQFDYYRADGTLFLTVKPEALMGDPTRMAPPKAKEAKALAAAPAGFQTIDEKQCTPEKVVGYCGPTKNLIHTDPAYAKTFGFRAPITAGNQLVHYMLEAIAKDGLPDKFDVEMRFLRPVFWDDRILVEGRRDGSRLSDLRLAKDDGKVASTGVVHSVG